MPPFDDLDLQDRVVGRYRIAERLGRGGMGVVYRAYDPQFKRQAAVKFLQDHADPRRFESEVETLACLEHPNIVRVYDGGTWEGHPWFAMEYVSGGDLSAKLRSTAQPPWESARLVMLLALAVQSAHDRNVLHRDLKPANILLALADRTTPHLNTTWGCPKIADFGLVKRLNQAGHTSPGSRPGTPVYMAPEQIQGEPGDVAIPTDVYGLGGILYEMLTGQPAFLGQNLYEILDKVKNAAPTPPRQLRPSIPEVLDTICRKCLSKSPAGRYQTAKALADALQSALLSDPDAPPPADDPAEKVDLNFDLIGMMKIFGESLYSEFSAIVRELAQNGHDAVVQAYCSSAATSERARITDYRVDVRYDQFTGMLVVADDGIGMNSGNIGQKLNWFGASDKPGVREEVLEARPGERWHIIGQYGVGFLSALALSDKVEVWSQQAGSDPVRWTYKRGWKYARVTERPPEELTAVRQRLNLPLSARSGTIVICYLSPGNQQKYKINSDAINRKLIRYTRLLRVPILFNDSPVSRLYGAWDDPARATESDWEAAIEAASEQAPLFVIPVFSSPDELDLEGVLWIPPRMRVLQGDGGGVCSVDIFVRRMFVTRDTRLVRPEWAGFVAGMINSNKISRIVSGDNFIEDDYARRTQEFVKDRIIDTFRKLRGLPAEDYWKIVGAHDDTIKASAVDTEEFMECVWDKLRLKLRGEQALTIPEYIAKVELKTGRNNVIYYYDKPTEDFAANTTSDSTGVPVLCLVGRKDDTFVRAVARRRNLELQSYRELAKGMYRRPDDEDSYRSLVVACASNNVAADVRVFQPSHIPAMLIEDQSLQERRWELLELIQRTGNRAAAEDLERLFEREHAANSGTSFYLNAANPLIQDLRDAPIEAQRSVCLALYNISFMSAIPELRKHEVQLIYNSISTVLGSLVNQCVGETPPPPGHTPDPKISKRPIRLVVLAPRGSTQAVQSAREVFESAPYYFEVVEGNGRSAGADRARDLREQIAGADLFLADLAQSDAEVLLEAGAVLVQSDRPVLALVASSNAPTRGFPTVVPIPFPGGSAAAAIRSALEQDGKPARPEILSLLERKAPRALTRNSLARIEDLQEEEIERIVAAYSTLDALLKADPREIEKNTGIRSLVARHVLQSLNPTA